MPEPTTRTLEVPGAVLTYDVREPQGPSTERTLVLVGSPMAAAGFTTLAGHFDDRRVVTYDPRGVERSTRTSDDPVTPETRADDLHRLVAEVGGGPVDVFASSGGAVDALAWVAAHPDDIATLVAHEPPLPAVLPDREAAAAAMRRNHEIYMAQGFGHGMAHFIAIVSHEGEYTSEVVEMPAPDPAMFGLPTEDDGSRDDGLMGVNMRTYPEWEPDLEAVRAAPTVVVPAYGEESRNIMTGRATIALAAHLGTEPLEFPGGHDGFLGGEYGQTGQPEPFAKRLREVLQG